MSNQLLKICVILTLFLGVSIASSCGSGDAEQHAKSYAKKLGQGYTSLGCVGNDSDDDGYVSCTILHPDKERSGIQCATGNSLTGGCNSAGCKEDTAKAYRSK